MVMMLLGIVTNEDNNALNTAFSIGTHHIVSASTTIPPHSFINANEILVKMC